MFIYSLITAIDRFDSGPGLSPPPVCGPNGGFLSVDGFFPVVTLSGDSFSMGRTHGKLLAEKIEANIQLYVEMIGGLTGMDKERMIAHARKFRPVLEEHAPHLLTEMEGIADGARLSIDEIIFLNARTEIVSMGDPKAVNLSGECTAIGLQAQRTADGKTYLAQNWDWHYKLTGSSAVFRIKPEDGKKMIILTEAGQVGKIGFNESGLGVLLNILLTGSVEYGVPVHVMLRMILEKDNVKDAVDLVKTLPRSSASHFLVGDDSGDVAGLELTSETVAELKPVDGVLVHTNHYCDPALVPGDVGKLLFLDSQPRFDRASKLLAAREKWNFESLKCVLINHDDGLKSICRHVDEAMPFSLRISTVSSVFIDLEGRRMLATRGKPCQANYHETALL